MIFTTVGTFQFDALVQCVDEAVGRGQIADDVLIQIGSGHYTPAHCKHFRSAPGLASYYSQADLVIGHGGTGTTLEILERGLRLISVRNPSLVDDHQAEFLEAMEERGLVRYCRNLEELPSLVQLSLRAPPPAPVDVGRFFRNVVDDLESL